MSELGGNEEGVGGRADSLNFFKVTLSSLRKSFWGKNFFCYLCPPTPVMLCVLGGGSSTGATLGKSCSIFFGQEVTLHSRGNWKPLAK